MKVMMESLCVLCIHTLSRSLHILRNIGLLGALYMYPFSVFKPQSHAHIQFYKILITTEVLPKFTFLLVLFLYTYIYISPHTYTFYEYILSLLIFNFKTLYVYRCTAKVFDLYQENVVNH